MKSVSYTHLTIAEIKVTDWQYQGSELNMTTRYTLYAGHRDMKVEALFEEPLKDEVFCTGVQDIAGSVSYSCLLYTSIINLSGYQVKATLSINP